MPAQKITETGVRRRYAVFNERAMLANWVTPIARFYPSDQAVENYPALGGVQPMRPWEGKRMMDQPPQYQLQIANSKFETGVHIPGDLIRRDKTAQVDDYLAALGGESASHVAEQLASLIVNGHTATIWDQTTFFSASHPLRFGGTNSNDISEAAATGTTPTTAEFANGMFRALAQINKQLKDNGQPIAEDATGNYVVMTKMEFLPQLQTALNATIIQGSSGVIDNPTRFLRGSTIDGFASPRLTADALYVFKTSNRGAPFIWQEEPLPGLDTVQILGNDSEFFLQNDAWYAGVAVSRGFGYAEYQYACRCTFT
jgi:phage major head subunit gpT-like protein